MDPARIGLRDVNDIPAPHTEPRRHSWTPQNLLELANNPPAPPTIGGLLYPGKRTLLSGETESLKTWLALILAKAELAINQPVAWVDLDDMGAGALLQRLRALNVPDEHLTNFLYYTPDERLYDIKTGQRTDILTDVLLQLTTVGPRLMVIDAFNPILSLHGLDPNSVTDIEAFWREIADPIAQTGAAPVLLDHVVKNAESRGKYASGSERKASGCTVHIGSHAIDALTIGGSGRAILTTHKDRPAYLPRPTIGTLKLESKTGENGEEIEYTIERDLAHTTGGFRPTILMERISKTLAVVNEPASQTWIEENVEGKAPGLRKALAQLVEEGYVERTTGPRNSLVHTLNKPYEQGDDPLLDSTTNDPVPTPSHPVPNLVSSTTPSPVPPLRGDGVVSDPVPSSSPSRPNGSTPEDAGPPNVDFWEGI